MRGMGKRSLVQFKMRIFKGLGFFVRQLEHCCSSPPTLSARPVLGVLSLSVLGALKTPQTIFSG